MPAASSPAGPPGVPAPSGSSAPPGRVAERAGWTVGRVIALLPGSVLVLASVVLLGGSGAVAWADHEQRGGYLSTGTATYSTGGYALAGNPVGSIFPATALDWSAQAEGTGTQTLRWTARTGDWTVVVMNPDGSPGVTARTDVGVFAPALPWLATWLLVAGAMADLLAAILILILIPVRLATGRT